MKKLIALLAVVLLCAAIAIPTVATGSFVGSPNTDTSGDHNNSGMNYDTTNKEEPPIKDEDLVDIDGVETVEDLMNLLQSETFLSIDDCIVVTNVDEAKAATTDISQETRDLLLEIYDKLVEGSMNLPIEGDFSVRDLVDVSFKYEGCELQEDHGNKAKILALPGVTLSVDFNLGVAADEELVVMTYNAETETWTEIESVTNNGDGTVTCVFEDICPVAFAVLG